ncbi:hypothetical protein OD91_2248 [Lutibacter sp. Hel_I_33_5]|uniref:hypothetical protein n=1 Tax=Lutibacter sp. Hel_I_33_5 TaxID=1566289 RepID=UPI0011A94FB7|nr:hypothetical protein [Lutibacter sp. Hel_I_33_5]TVZ56944.1 hypothetical protein OD91_2248 [Lutibacter sp. Hel_I_33_5]
MNKENYLKDIAEIKNLMTKSSRFISLSGLSGVFAGIYAILGAVYYYFNDINTGSYSAINAIIVILIVGFLSSVTTIIMTSRRAKITDEKIWSSTTKQLVSAFITTLCIGLVFISILLLKNQYKEAIPLLPLFYGLSLLHAAKHTNNIVKPLGILQIVIGLLCALIPKFSFWFLVIGFGIIHIIYGAVIYFKYDKK